MPQSDGGHGSLAPHEGFWVGVVLQEVGVVRALEIAGAGVLPRRMRFVTISAKKRSTGFNQDSLVGAKYSLKRGCFFRDLVMVEETVPHNHRVVLRHRTSLLVEPGCDAGSSDHDPADWKTGYINATSTCDCTFRASFAGQSVRVPVVAGVKNSAGSAA